MSTGPVFIETVNPSLSSCCAIALNCAVLSRSLEVRNYHNLGISSFVLTTLYSLQIWVELKPCVKSCRHRLTHWLSLMLASIYSNNRFANVCLLADVSPANSSCFMCRHEWRSSNFVFTKFWLHIFVARFEWTKCWTGRTVQTMLVKLGSWHPSMSISMPLLWQNSTFFCIASNDGTTSLFLYQRKKSLNDCILSCSHTVCKKSSSLLQQVVFRRVSFWAGHIQLSNHYASAFRS